MDEQNINQNSIINGNVSQQKPRSKPKILPESKGMKQDDKNDHRIWKTVIIALLTLQVLLTIFQVVDGQIKQAKEETYRKNVIQSVQTYTKNIDSLTVKMLDDYKKDVYNNSKVDSTSKQQVMANEYNFNAIMLLIKQNSRMMEMLSQLR